MTVAAREGAWFGFSLPQLDKSFDVVLERARRAEAAGFDSIWLNDHLQPTFDLGYDGRLNSFEAWTLATALAASTRTIRFGHAVLCDSFRHPALLARMAATLDVISGGRLDLGLGWGSINEELDRYGFGARPAVERAARLRETLEILDLMFRCEPFDYHGEYYRLRDAVGAPRPVQARIPIFIGGSGPKLTLPLVRDFADWWNAPGSPSALKFEEGPDPRAWRDRIGSARIAVTRLIALGADDESARAAAGWFAQRAPARAASVLSGVPEHVAAGLIADAADGAEGWILSFHDDGAETLELFMNEVAPRVREARSDLSSRPSPAVGSVARMTDGGDPSRIEIDPPAVRARLSTDAEFRRASRYWTARVVLDIGADSYELVMREGAVTSFERGSRSAEVPDVRLAATSSVWRRLLAAEPPPGYQDFRIAAGRAGSGLTVVGDLGTVLAPYYDAIRRLVRVIAEVTGATRPSTPVPDTARLHDGAVGRYVYVHVDGVQYRIYYEEVGHGIPLLLQHTAGADGRQWRHMLEDPDYQRNFRMIAYDLPFHGRSLPPTGVRWWEQEYRLTRSFLMDVVVTLSRALELERPAYLGCSIGGHLAPDLALYHPDEFRAVVGVNGGLGGAGRPAAAAPGLSITESFDHPRISDEWRAAAMLGSMAPRSPEAYQRETAWVYGQGAPSVLKGDVHYYSVDHDLTAEQARTIDTSKVAVYLLTGEYDPLSDDSGTPELARNITGSTYRLVRGAGHFGPAEDPEGFKSALLPILDEIAARSVDAS